MVENSNSDCASKLRILAEPNRLAVVRTLANGPQVVNQLERLLNIEQSLLSHHLRTLRNAGFVRSARSGKTITYRLADSLHDSIRNGLFDLGCCQLSFSDETT